MIQSCWCSSSTFLPYSSDHTTPTTYIQCTVCSTVIQKTTLTSMDFLNFYQSGFYHTQHQINKNMLPYQGRRLHDYKVAESRLSNYKIPSKSLILDVGCGSGMFVLCAREHGIEAYGQDLWKDLENPYVYSSSLSSISFPTDYFDYVTCHDVLEHVENPNSFLSEISRIIKQNGFLILDYPMFFSEEGKHHWKAIEHLWMLSPAQLQKILTKHGFEITKTTYPEWEGKRLAKIVLFCRKPPEQRTSILVPPGIGDSYWAIIKLRDFCIKRRLGIPDVFIAGRGDRNISKEFVERFPFLHCSGYAEDFTTKDPIFNEAYLQDGRQLFENVHGMDFFLSANGILRFGKNLTTEYLPEYETEWRPPMFFSLEERKKVLSYQHEYGPYSLFYLPVQSIYKRWFADIDREYFVAYAKELRRKGRTPILVGAGWDEDPLRCSEVVNLIGKTTFSDLLSLLHGAQSVVGFPSGLTILSTVLRKPTFMWWNDYFDRRMWTNCCPHTENYVAWDSKQLLSPEDFIEQLLRIEAIPVSGTE